MHQNHHSVPRVWTASLGGEAVYEVDLPSCCRRDARSASEGFECVECGAMWEIGATESPEVCGFTVEVRQDRLGAA